MHKVLTRQFELLLKVLCTFNLFPVFRGWKKIAPFSIIIWSLIKLIPEIYRPLSYVCKYLQITALENLDIILSASLLISYCYCTIAEYRKPSESADFGKGADWLQV